MQTIWVGTLIEHGLDDSSQMVVAAHSLAGLYVKIVAQANENHNMTPGDADSFASLAQVNKAFHVNSYKVTL